MTALCTSGVTEPLPREDHRARRGQHRALIGAGVFVLGLLGPSLQISRANGSEGVPRPASPRASEGAKPDRSASDAGGYAAAKGMVRGRVRVPGGRVFEVEVVQDPASRQRGLQHRARLPENEGMLFVFPKPQKQRFWMYQCLIPLDIVWMDQEKRVIAVESKLPICADLPCPDYGPDEPCTYVLELGAGVAAHAGIKSGVQLEMLFSDRLSPE